MIRRVFERSPPDAAPTIESSTARNRPHDWAERREPVTQCCRNRHRLVLKGCDVRKPSPPPEMIAGFSYGFSADGLARYGAAQRSSHHDDIRDRWPLPLWRAHIPQKAGSTRRISSSPMRLCASSTPLRHSPCRRRVTSRRAGCRRRHGCRASTPRTHRHGADCFAPSGSIGRGDGASVSGPRAAQPGSQCAACAERGMP